MSDASLRCSFCHKDQASVRKLIAGPNNVCICDECIKVCVDIVNDDPYVRKGGERVAPPPRLEPYTEWTSRVKCALCGMPIPPEHAIFIPERGPLCVGCVGEIDAALAREPDRDSE